MEQIENELLKELEDMLNHHQAQDCYSPPFPDICRAISLVQDNADIVSILIGENGDLNFVNRLKHIVREKCLKDWMALKPLRNYDFKHHMKPILILLWNVCSDDDLYKSGYGYAEVYAGQ